jgi:hypothetical protein
MGRRASPPDGTAPDPMARARTLAERMAKRLDREDVADISLALAFLTSGIVHQYADDFTRARELVTGIRKLEDRLLESAYKAGPTRVH